MVPAGLRRQWSAELSAWFDLKPIAVDARWLRGRVADVPADVSPWAAPGVYLGSVDFLKRPDVAASLDGSGLYRKRGCPRCGQTGYRGRIGIFQLLMMSATLEELAARKASRDEIERAAMEGGMRTLWDDGMTKVAAGLTSIEELARVCMT